MRRQMHPPEFSLASPSSAQQRKPPTRAHTCTGVQLVTPLLPVPSPYPAARVAVDDQTWRAFRQAAIVRGISVSAYLGKLVTDELRRRKAGPVDIDSEQPPADQALAALAAVRSWIDELDDIAGRLARSALEHGGSWKDVASSLHLTQQAARHAYEKR